ncbi:MAG TPA: fibronectin type III domain-containing protein, partial [Thermoanaerobaculia bacterium]
MRLQIGKRIAAAAWIGCLLGSWPLLGQQVRDDPARRIPALASAAKTGKALGVSPKAHECNHFGAISCGQTVNGSLSSADCDLDDGSFIDFWEFQGSSGQTVTVTMTSQQIDPFLFLFDPAPTEAARNDDINNTTTTARVTFKLDATGPWTIGANSAFPSETGSYSLTLTCTGGPIGGGVPAAPTNLRTTSVSETEVELAWNDNANNEIGYRIELREEGGVFEDIGAVGTNATSAVIEGLEPGTIYTFRVRARNAAGDSAYSNEVRVSTPGGDGVITSPFFPDFRFRVRIVQNATTIFQGRKESDCIPETLCVSGAVAGRSEVFLRIIGPRPNGYLWPTIVRFTPSRVEVDIQQISTGIVKTYV